MSRFQSVWKVRQEILAEQHSAARTLLQKLLSDNGQLLSLELKNLPTDAAEIAKFLDASIIEKISQYTSDVKSAEKQTADADAAFNNKQWYDAPCQKMIEEITQIIEIASALSFSYWYEFLPLDSAEAENPSRLEQLSDLITRLQRNQVIRYNLWATQVCQDQSNHQIQNFNTIDPSLLSPAVQAIYYQKVNNIIQKESYSMKENIRQLMTAKKTPLSDF